MLICVHIGVDPSKRTSSKDEQADVALRYHGQPYVLMAIIIIGNFRSLMIGNSRHTLYIYIYKKKGVVQQPRQLPASLSA